jgi:autotransporter-associated beta strand protein
MSERFTATIRPWHLSRTVVPTFHRVTHLSEIGNRSRRTDRTMGSDRLGAGIRRRTICASFVLALGGTVVAGPSAQSQSLDLPLGYYEYEGNLRLTANIGIGNEAPQTYLFDTGSNLFNVEFLPEVFGSKVNFPVQTSYGYGSGLSLQGQLVGVQSLTFYPTSTPENGVTVNAQTPSGGSSTFLINAVTKLRLPGEIAYQPITGLTPFFGNVYGIFGAGAFVTPINPTLYQYSSPLGQTVIPGTIGGYVVAANGEPLKSIDSKHMFSPAAYANGPQGSQHVTSCSPCVILGLTPALLAQFQPQNALPWTSKGIPFWNSGYPSTTEFGVQVNYTVAGALQTSRANAPVLLDSGTPITFLQGSAVAGQQVVPNGSKFTYSGTQTGAFQIANTVVSNSPSQVQLSNGSPIFGINFFLQNSVLYDLEGQEIAYTPNFVTDANITTPLSIDSTSPPLGLAGNITGSGGVTLSRGGSATLSGDNTYTGPTNVSGGYLALVGPGTIAASSGIDVSQGGVLTGTGTIGSLSVTIGAGGTLAPGLTGGPGASMAIRGNLIVQPGSAYQVGLAPSSSNFANVSGFTSLAGTVQAIFTPSLYHPQQYMILQASDLGGAFSGLQTLSLPV